MSFLCARIYRGALWILGEYCSTKDDIQNVMTEVRRSLGEVGLFVFSNHTSAVIIAVS